MAYLLAFFCAKAAGDKAGQLDVSDPKFLTRERKLTPKRPHLFANDLLKSIEPQ
jgi:hypothetical protein